MQELRQQPNAVRMLYLGWELGEELEEVIRLDPEHLQARLDLVRYYVMAPRVVGGSMDKARAQAAELASRDTALGVFAYGYIAYREKEYGLARSKLRDAIRLAKSPSTKILALTWLGWLSQESQQYDDAFAAWSELLSLGRQEALYEIGRTAVFANRDLDRGELALQQYLKVRPTAEMPTLAQAHLQLALLYERRGDVGRARREVAVAVRLDPKLEEARRVARRLR